MTEDELAAIIRNGSAGPEPSEFIINGGFATDTDWTKGIGWTIAAGQASNSGVGSNLTQSAMVQPLIAGHQYTLTFTYTGFISGLNPRVITPGVQAFPDAAGSPYSHTFTATAAFAGFSFSNIDSESGDLDNVSLVPA